MQDLKPEVLHQRQHRTVGAILPPPESPVEEGHVHDAAPAEDVAERGEPDRMPPIIIGDEVPGVLLEEELVELLGLIPRRVVVQSPIPKLADAVPEILERIGRIDVVGEADELLPLGQLQAF